MISTKPSEELPPGYTSNRIFGAKFLRTVSTVALLLLMLQNPDLPNLLDYYSLPLRH